MRFLANRAIIILMLATTSSLFARRTGWAVLGLCWVLASAPGASAQRILNPQQSNPQAEQTAEFQKLADRWDDAVGQHDQYGLELVLAPQYIGITDQGEVQNRDELVSQMVMKGAEHYSMQQKVTSVRELGDVAVVNGMYDRLYPASRLSHIKARDEKGVFSQVWIRAHNSWQCINSQRTLIANAVSASQKKKADKAKGESLGHDLRFHLPGHHSSGDNN